MARGYAVWWDFDLESWGSYQSQIDAALAEAAVVVVIWSEGAAASVYVKAEANKALSAGKLINVRPPEFPVSAVPSPYNALHIDTLDLAEPYRLLRSIRGVWAGKPRATAKPLYESYHEAFGVDLFDPKRAPLDRDPAMLAPSDLLQARSEAVPFIDAIGLGQEMQAWCRDGARATAGMLIHGPGGFGKTRLMIETARALRAEDWLAGFLSPLRRPDDVQEVRQREQALEQVFALGDEPGVLLVVDYAENRQAEVVALAKLLAARPREAAKPVRVVLLARSDQWWADFMAQDHVPRLFAAPSKPKGDVRALVPIPEGTPRSDFFVASVTAFEPLMAAMAQAGSLPGWNCEPPSQQRLIQLRQEPAFERPLSIQMEALLFLASSSPEAGAPGIDTLLDRVLDLEQAHWRKLLGLMDDDRRRDMIRAVAQVTAVQGVSDTAAAQRLLMADAFYEGTRTAPVQVDRVLRDLTGVYGRANGGVAQLEPDLVGEHHIVRIDRNAIELLDGCLRWVASEPEAARPKRYRDLLTVLQRATHLVHGEAARQRACTLIGHIVRHYTVAVAKELIAVILDTPGEAITRITLALPKLLEGPLTALDSALPQQSLALVGMSLQIAERRVALAREAIAPTSCAG